MRPKTKKGLTRSKQISSFLANIRKCEFCKGSEDRITKLRGSTRAKVAFLTEAPGLTEAEYGLPAVSRHYARFQAMLTKHGGLDPQHEAVFIPVLFCAMPRPTKTNFVSCETNVRRALDLIQPKLVGVLGQEVVKWVLSFGRGSPSMNMLRGRPVASYDYPGIVFFIFSSPATLESDQVMTGLARSEFAAFKKTYRKVIRSE